MKKILFVCMGNICRSAAAEAVLQKKVIDSHLENEFEIDSAGIIDYHAGEPADKRMRETAWERGYKITSSSRQVKTNDLDHFDMIIAMDDSNVRGLKAIVTSKEQLNKITKLTDFCTEEYLKANNYPTYVPDPYYGGTHGFYLVLDMLENACEQIIKLNVPTKG